MAYVKQHTITNGQPAQAVQVTENFEDVKRYIDRGIIQADLSNASVDAPEIVRGEINAYTRDHQFTCGDGYGIFLDSNTRNIQPMTNTYRIGLIRLMVLLLREIVTLSVY